MGSIINTEMRLDMYYIGNKVFYKLNDDIIRTGTITSICSNCIKIKDSVTYIIPSVPDNKVRHSRYQF